MTNSDLKTQFLHRLNGEDLSLDDRLNIASGALLSEDFCVNGKEQIIIDWFGECFSENIHHAKSLLKMLIKCLKSDCLQTCINTIDATKIIEAVINLDSNLKKKYCKYIIKCLILILKTNGFQRYCRYEIQPMCQAVLLVCESWVATSAHKGVLDESTFIDDVTFPNTVSEELCHCIHSIYKVTQQRNEMKQRFVKFILPTMLKSDSNISESRRFLLLIEELIIGEDAQLFLEAFKLETKKKIPTYLKALVTLLTKNEEKCDIVTIVFLIFDVYVSSCLKNFPGESHHLSLFYILMSVIGLQLPLSDTTVTATNLSVSEQLCTLSKLVAVLHKHNVVLNTESHEGGLQQCLIVMLKRLLSGEYPVSSELLQTVINIFKLYPESVRPVFSLIMLQVVLVRKENKVLKSYDQLMMNVVKIFSDLNRLEKFFEFFFQGAVLISKEQELSGLTSEMVLGKGFYSVLSEKLSSLTGNQIKLIIGKLDKIFSKHFVTPLESTCLQDQGFSLLLKLIINVLCHILENAPIFFANRWNIVSEDVHNIGLNIQRFGVAILRGCQVELDNKYEFLLEFLRLVKVMADLDLVVNEYIISMSGKSILPMVKSKDKSDVVHNLTKSHGFLIPQEWIYISENVREALDKQLTIAWQDLLLQKFTRLGDKETLAHLVVEGVTEWLWRTVATVAPLVPLRHLELYTDKLISSIGSPQQLALLDNINVLSNRAFRVAMTFQSLNHLARSENSSLSGRLAKLFDIQPVMKFELEISNVESERVSGITSALAEAINRHRWEDQASLTLSHETKTYYKRVFDVLSLMHSHCLKLETKRIVCLMMMGLSCDLKCETDLLPNILDYMLGCLDDNTPVIPESLHGRAMSQWLARVVPVDYPHRPQMYVAALTKILPSLASATEDTGLTSSEDLVFSALQALTLAYKTGRLKNNDEYNKLATKLISSASSLVCVKKPKPITVLLFTAAVKAEYLFFKEISLPLANLLPKYLEILLQGLAGSDVLEPDAVELVEVVLHHRTEVAPELVALVCTTVTKELCRTDPCPILCYPSTVQAFLQTLSVDVFQQALMKIHGCQAESVSNLSELWSIVVGVQVGREKAQVRDNLLGYVLAHCQKLVEDVSKFHSNLLTLLHAIVVHKSVKLSSKLLDLVLVILGEAPTDSQPQLLHDSLTVLNALINVRAELMFDRIPVFLQRLRKLIKSLVLLSPSEESEMLTYNIVSSNSVNQVTRIIKKMTDYHGKHFARISPYLIADILHLLVTHSVETSVKAELQICMCSLLTICDHHGTQQLQNLLPVASVELYKVVTTTFNKDYKYTGKV